MNQILFPKNSFFSSNQKMINHTFMIFWLHYYYFVFLKKIFVHYIRGFWNSTFTEIFFSVISNISYLLIKFLSIYLLVRSKVRCDKNVGILISWKKWNFHVSYICFVFIKQKKDFYNFFFDFVLFFGYFFIINFFYVHHIGSKFLYFFGGLFKRKKNDNKINIICFLSLKVIMKFCFCFFFKLKNLK